MRKSLDTVFNFQRKHFKEIAGIGAGEAASFAVSGVPFIGAAVGLVVKFGLEVLSDTAEIKAPVLEPGKHGDFISEDAFYLENVYRNETPIWRGIPYTQTHSFIEEIIAAKRASIRIRPSPDFFEITPFEDQTLEALRDAAEAEFRAQRRITHDSDIIRLDAVSRDDDALLLDISRTKYSRQARSNLVLDFSPGGKGQSLRQALSAENFGYLPNLSDTRLANTIGLAILIFYKDNGRLTPFFVPRTREVAIFNKGEWHCTASGAAEWPLNPEQTPKTFQAYILDDLFAELREEVGLNPEDLSNILPLALCREFARGGKPQMFFIGFTDLSHAELMDRMEKARKITLPRAEPTEVYRMPFFRFPPKFPDAESIARSFEEKGFTSEAAANLFYATRFLQAAEKREAQSP
ncbi:hypothetical protein [Hoeflea sp.]|uniref:hypothetical protein n=1 Tax=Hoeflea sp. TaxID=1940281 RepID=UPI001987D666|nr:hypothetical protein [Hoeflea sp.]MBC7281250.1 hypothetical protein [Hoeflea sp.]